MPTINSSPVPHYSTTTVYNCNYILTYLPTTYVIIYTVMEFSWSSTIVFDAFGLRYR